MAMISCRMSGLWSCVDASARDRWNEPNQNVHRVQKIAFV